MTSAVVVPAKQCKTTHKTELSFCLSDLPFIFIAGGFIGTVYEFLLAFITTGVLEDRTGSVLTPFNYVYGIGAVVMFLVLYRMKNPIQIYLTGCILGGVVEFALSYLQETLFGTVSWDYSEKFLNIGGRTTIPYMLVWGVLCLIAVKYVFPFLLKLIQRIPDKTRKVIAAMIICIMSIDAVITLTASIRFAQRTAGASSQSGIVQLIDSIFHDKYMATHFPNMKIH